MFWTPSRCIDVPSLIPAARACSCDRHYQYHCLGLLCLRAYLHQTVCQVYFVSKPGGFPRGALTLTFKRQPLHITTLYIDVRSSTWFVLLCRVLHNHCPPPAAYISMTSTKRHASLSLFCVHSGHYWNDSPPLSRFVCFDGNPFVTVTDG